MAPSRAPNEFHEELKSVLHDLAQPVTTLRCRLELALMQPEHSASDPDELREAAQDGLEDIRCIFELIERLRHSLLAEMKLHP